MATLIEVWESRLGTAEIAGKKHNPAILQMWIDAGHPEIIDDETAWCSASQCSTALAAGLPFPPPNVNPMARSWLTMGVTVEPRGVQPNDVVVWPRGKPNSGQGHVNTVKEVRKRGKTMEVRCIGGNQSHKSGGAITVTDWTDVAGALPNGIRRLVPATVKDLRQAGSSEIRQADTLEKAGILSVFTVPILKGIEWVASLFGGDTALQVPQFAGLPEGLTWWQSVLGGLNAIGGYVAAHPYLGLTAIVGLGLWALSRRIKAKRVVKHAAGVPIAAAAT